MDNKNLIKILLVDDEEDILEFLSYNLIKEGYIVYKAKNGIEAIGVAKKVIPNLIIMDIMMPQLDGINACKKIRQQKELESTLIVFLTARGEDYSQIAGFDAGADDYISKPIAPKVLVSRIKAILKRQQVTDDNKHNQIIRTKSLTINKERYIVTYNGTNIVLPRKEFELLALLASKTDKVFTREEIYNTIWGIDVCVGNKTIDVHIRKLREKFGNELVETIKGVGYKFSE